MDRGALWIQSMASQRVRHDWATFTIVFPVCHGFLHPYRRILYWGQTIQGGLETVGFYGHNLILSISIFLKLWKWSQFFFSKQCSFSRLLEKTAWVESFFVVFFSFWEKKVSCINRAYIFVQTFIVFEY